MNTVECPKCAIRLAFEETPPEAGAEIFCPQCGNNFNAPPPASAFTAHSQSAAVA